MTFRSWGRLALALGMTLGVTGCSAVPAPSLTQQPTGTAHVTPTERPSSAEPAATVSPGPSAESSPTDQLPEDTFVPEPGEEEITDAMLNPPPEPLPEPQIESVDEIVEAIFDGGDAAQAVVSMLRALGIGVYNVDGTPIRRGTEASDADLYLFEPEVRGLIAMLEAQADGETWMSFRDFHADLQEFGLQATPAELLQVYLDTYAERPDTPMTRFVQAQAFLDVEAQIPPLGVWLLFVDGMIPPHAASAQIALAGRGLTAQGGNPNIGQAFQELQQLINSPHTQRQVNSARARAVLAGAALRLEASRELVHKGHGGPGDSVTFSATVNSFVFNSGFGGVPIGPCAGGSLAGIDVYWYHGGLEAHGTTSVPNGLGTTVTNAGGRTSMTFETSSEAPDGVWRSGVQTTAIGGVKAIVDQVSVARALCPGVPVGRGGVVGTNPLHIRIRYHVPRAILVTLTNSFDMLFKGGSQLGGDADLQGDDVYVGRLVEEPDGTWHGYFLGRASGAGTGVFWAADRTCTNDYAALQVLEVFGEAQPSRLPSDPPLSTNGDFLLTFYPAAPPVAQVGTTLCRAARRPGSRYDWAPFNSTFVWSGIGLGIVLPDDPGGDRQYLEASESSTVVYEGLTGWTVNVRYLRPPP